MNIDKYSLILAVQKRPILWDFSLQNELKIRKKYDEWTAVSFEVTGQSDDETVHSIKSTWTSLLTIFRRIYKNNINKPYGHNIEVQWKYYSTLQFLRKNYDENRLQTASPDDIMFTPQTASTDRQPSSTSTRTKSRKRKSMDADQDDILTQQAQTTAKNHTKRKSEQMIKFIESYEDVWETFSIEELTEIKMKISEGIVEILRIKENKHD